MLLNEAVPLRNQLTATELRFDSDQGVTTRILKWGLNGAPIWRLGGINTAPKKQWGIEPSIWSHQSPIS